MDDAPSLPNAEDIFAQPVASVSSTHTPRTFLPQGTTVDIHGFFTRHIGGKRDYNDNNWGAGLTIPISINGSPSENWSISFGGYQNSFKDMPSEQKGNTNGRTNTVYLMFNYERATAFKPFERNTKLGISLGAVDYYGRQKKAEFSNIKFLKPITNNRLLNTVSAAFQFSATIQANDHLSFRAGLVPLKTLSNVGHQLFGTEVPKHASDIVNISLRWSIN